MRLVRQTFSPLSSSSEGGGCYCFRLARKLSRASLVVITSVASMPSVYIDSYSRQSTGDGPVSADRSALTEQTPPNHGYQNDKSKQAERHVTMKSRNSDAAAFYIPTRQPSHPWSIHTGLPKRPDQGTGMICVPTLFPPSLASADRNNNTWPASNASLFSPETCLSCE